MNPTVCIPSATKNGPAMAMVAPVGSGQGGCTNHECAEKSAFAGFVSAVFGTKTHCKPSGASPGVELPVVDGPNPFRPAASLIPSRMARLSTSYEIQMDAIKATNKMAISNSAARCISTSKSCTLSSPSSNKFDDCGSSQSAIARNAHQWRAIGDFLEIQQLALLGLSRVVVRDTQGGGGPGAQRPDASGLREASPMVITGISTLKLTA